MERMNERENILLRELKQKFEFALFLTNRLIASEPSMKDFNKNLKLRDFNNPTNSNINNREKWDLVKKNKEIQNILHYKRFCILLLSQMQYYNTEKWLKLKPLGISEQNFYTEFDQFIKIFDYFLAELVSIYNVDNLGTIKASNAPIFGLFQKLNRYFKSVSKILELGDLKLVQNLFQPIHDLYFYESSQIFEIEFQSEELGQFDIDSDYNQDISSFSDNKIKLIKEIKFNQIKILANNDTDFLYLLLEKIGNENAFQKHNRFVETVNLFFAKLINYYHTNIDDPQIIVLFDEIYNQSGRLMNYLSDEENQIIQACVKVCDSIYDFRPKVKAFRDAW